MSEVIERIDAFLDRHSLTPSAFGKLAANSSHLVPRLRSGARPRASTIAKIAEFMERYEKEQEEADLAALLLVKRCGFVSVEADGVPRLETVTQIDRTTFNRLLQRGLLRPSGDALFGLCSQTYRPAEVEHAA